ncbi:MAG TPA: Ku protein [Candidatus Eisenbacteria bacterium]|nr:Ku protein [Candidatus Eisenbacteria bacterium]
MPARSVGSGTVSFGLVSIPVRFYVATHSESPSFNMLHQACGSRIKQQVYCPRDERVVERSELIRGYEVAKDQYVTFTDEELRALEAAASPSIDIEEFVPLEAVDPIYFETSHYLGPDKGGDKAYHLLADAMRETGVVAVAQHVSRGKERLVLIRPIAEGLAIHTLYYADEVRPFGEIGLGEPGQRRAGEMDLAKQLVGQLTSKGFRPEQYHDHYRDRLREIVEKKVAGEEMTIAEPATPRAQVIDLMDALKQSLARERKPGAMKPAAVVAVASKRRATGGSGRAASKKKQ